MCGNSPGGNVSFSSLMSLLLWCGAADVVLDGEVSRSLLMWVPSQSAAADHLGGLQARQTGIQLAAFLFDLGGQLYYALKQCPHMIQPRHLRVVTHVRCPSVPRATVPGSPTPADQPRSADYQGRPPRHTPAHSGRINPPLRRLLLRLRRTITIGRFRWRQRLLYLRLHVSVPVQQRHYVRLQHVSEELPHHNLQCMRVNLYDSLEPIGLRLIVLDYQVRMLVLVQLRQPGVVRLQRRNLRVSLLD